MSILNNVTKFISDNRIAQDVCDALRAQASALEADVNSDVFKDHPEAWIKSFKETTNQRIKALRQLADELEP